MTELTCPRCSESRLDEYPDAHRTKYCTTCCCNFRVENGGTVSCERPTTGDGGWLIPVGIAEQMKDLCVPSHAPPSEQPVSFRGFVISLLLILLGAGVAIVGGLQIYMAAVAALVGTQAFEMSNRELALMGFDLLGMGAAAATLGYWTVGR